MPTTSDFGQKEREATKNKSEMLLFGVGLIKKISLPEDRDIFN